MSNNQQPPVLGTNQAPQAQPPYDDEIDLLELWRALMRGKWIIIAFTAVFSVASVFYALSLPNMYKSTAVLAPAESSGGGLGKLFSIGKQTINSRLEAYYMVERPDNAPDWQMIFTWQFLFPKK